tara:strand:- start:431 stop:1561 length:1131 start_codon:yes stop_codon:yes gene_type:complete
MEQRFRLSNLSGYTDDNSTSITRGKRSLHKSGALPRKSGTFMRMNYGAKSVRSPFISTKTNRDYLVGEYKLSRKNKQMQRKFWEDQQKAGKELRKKLRPFLVVLLGAGVTQQILSTPNKIEASALLAERYNANPGNHSWMDPPSTRYGKFYSDFLKELQGPREKRDKTLIRIKKSLEKSFQLKLPTVITTPGYRKQLAEAQNAVQEYLKESRKIAKKQKELQTKTLSTIVEKERNAEFKAIKNAHASDLKELQNTMRSSQAKVEITNQELVKINKNRESEINKTDKELEKLEKAGAELNKERNELLEKLKKLDESRTKISKTQKQTEFKKASTIDKFKSKKDMLKEQKKVELKTLKKSQQNMVRYTSNLKSMVGRS